MNNIKKYTQKDRYGGSQVFEFHVPEMNIPSKPDEGHPGDARGTDTVPAWLTPGENVVNAEASRLPGNQQKIDQMNDQGRAIQKQQGGPIPSYEADGGVVSIPNPMLDSAVDSMYQQYLGSNPGGFDSSGQYFSKDDMRSLLSQEKQFQPLTFNQGGQVPMYSAAGDFVIDDAMLDAVSQVESNNDPQALSGVGAGGQYQIMPATAQQPGYGTTPISLEDRFDPVKARAFAKEYLQGIMRQHPDFSKEQVLTAYHSGAGNVLKNNIGPVGKAYAGKIANAMQPSSKSLLSYFNPISTAQASTMSDREKKDAALLKGIETEADPDNRIGDPGYIPMPEDPILPNVDAMNPGFVDKRDEEFFDFKNNDMDAYFGIEQRAQEDLDTHNEMITKKLKKGISPTENDLYLRKRLEKKLEKGRQGILDTQNNIDAENKIDKAKLDSFNMEFDIPPDIDVSKNIEEKKKKEAQAIVDKLSRDNSYNLVMDEAEITYDTNTSNNQNYSDMLIQKAKGAGKVVLDKSIEFFKEAFSSMFNGEELARMAMVYAGSRAMGYDHGGSLNYSMKNYIKRVDSNLAAAKTFSLTDKAREDYEEASLKKYAKTGDRDDLIAKIKSNKVMSQDGSVYVKGIGVVPTFKMSDKTTRLQINGEYLLPNDPLIDGRVENIDPTVHGIAAIKKNFSDFTKAETIKQNSELGLGETTVNGTKSDNSFKVNHIQIGQEAQAYYSDLLKSNHLSLRDAAPYEAAVGRGIQKYIEALGYSKTNKTKTPMSLEAYLNAQTFVPLSGVNVSMVGQTTPKELLEITNKVVSQIPSKFKKSSPLYRLVFNNEWQMRQKAWQNITSTEREKFIDQAKNRSEPSTATKGAVGWDGFTWWVSQTSESEIKKILDDAGIEIPTVS